MSPFTRIPFAGGEVTRVDDKVIINHVQKLLVRTLGISDTIPNVTPKVVPPLPISPESKHKNIIKGSPFLYSEKADGVRYLAVLCMVFANGAWRKLCLLCGRNKETLIVPLVIGERLFLKESIFDGELVKTWGGNWIYLVFDAYMYEGQSLISKPFIERASYYQRFVDENYAYMPSDPFQVKCKKFFVFRQASPEILRSIMNNNAENKAFDYPTDGVVLIHAHSDVHAGTCKNMLKFKGTHTLDLSVQPHPDGKGYALCSMRIDARTGEVTMLPHAALDELPLGVNLADIVECSLRWDADAEHMHIEPMHVRRDKDEPNATWVCERTFQTVKDALTLDELIQTIHTTG